MRATGTARDVACPSCRAAIGVLCTSGAVAMKVSHLVRTALWTRDRPGYFLSGRERRALEGAGIPTAPACRACGGRGRVSVVDPDADDEGRDTRTCRDCGGFGQRPATP